MRAAIHLFEEVFRPVHDATVYLTEQSTSLFKLLHARYPGAIGSEYLGEDIARGSTNEKVLRHEDITRLSFADAALDYVLSFDVLEHVPSYLAALAELHRVLRPGGGLLLSVPFRPDSDETLVRARIEEDGTITHLMPPEYHGDPLRAEGCLSFYQFGWDLLRDLGAAGFTDVRALHYRSERFGYLGRDPLILAARRA